MWPFIFLKVNHNFSKDVEINIANTDMSRDNIIFMKELYPIPQENIVVIGTAYRYDYFVCIEDSLVDVEIIDSNIDNPKSIVESFWL